MASRTPLDDRPEVAPTFPEQRLHVKPLIDHVVDSLGHDPRSLYVEQFWLPILGPSSTWLLRRLATGLDEAPTGFELDPVEYALALGLGARGGKHGPFWRSLERACRFGMADRHGDLLAVRRFLPPLSARRQGRLPDHLRRAHQAWSARQLANHRAATTATAKRSPIQQERPAS